MGQQGEGDGDGNDANEILVLEGPDGYHNLKKSDSISNQNDIKENDDHKDDRFVPVTVDRDGNALTVSWKNCSVKTKLSPLKRLFRSCCPTWTTADDIVTLLTDQNGSCKAKFFAIMGPSGCGKTTFLNMIAKRLQAYKCGEENELRLGGKPYTKHNLKELSGYVLADDVLFPHLTVRETLEYAAQLRMAAEIPREDKIARVDQIINRLGLEQCQYTPIGDSIHRGVSGGERKRVCIALELLNRPKVLLLDTPTSGLDSATAYSICHLLAEMARCGECTVIISLNQPQIKIFQLFDELLFLNKGQVLYQGPPDLMIEAYAEAGFPLPPDSNPADHLLDVITPLFQEDFEHVDQNVEILQPVLRRYQKSSKDQDNVNESLDRDGHGPSWFAQFWLLVKRTSLSQFRDRYSLYLQIIQTLIISVLVGTVFLDIGTDQTSIDKRQSVLFFCCINQGIFSALLAVNSYPADRSVVLRERAAGTYSVSAYFMAKAFVETIVQSIPPALFTCIVYFLIGFQADAGKFFIFLLFMELCSHCAFVWALLTSALCVTVATSLSILPFIFDVWRLFGGFYLSPAESPLYFIWLDSISYIRFAYVGISLNELDGLNYTCTSKQLVPPVNGTCPITSGQHTIDTLGLGFISVGGCIGILIAFLLTLRFFNYLAIRYNKM